MKTKAFLALQMNHRNSALTAFHRGVEQPMKSPSKTCFQFRSLGWIQYTSLFRIERIGLLNLQVKKRC